MSATHLRIVFATDLHGSQGHVRRLAEAEAGAELLLLGGDLTHFAGAAQVEAVLAPLRAAFPVMLAVPGNCDRPEVAAYLAEQGVSLHGRGAIHADLGLVGVGGSNPTPFGTPLELPEARLGELLASGREQLGDSPAAVAVCHPPPHDTAADRLWSGNHVGSHAVRAFVASERPALCLCGHIHEAHAVDRIGETLVINPGGLFQGRYAAIELDGDDARAELRQLDASLPERVVLGARHWRHKIGGFLRWRLGR